MKMRNRRKARMYSVVLSFCESQVAGFNEAMSGWMDHVRSMTLDAYVLVGQIDGFRTTATLEEAAVRTLHLAVKDAIQFIQHFPERVALPWASYSADGEVFLKWKQGSREAEMMFSGGGEVGYAILRDGAFVAGANEASPDKAPDDLIDYLEG